MRRKYLKTDVVYLAARDRLKELEGQKNRITGRMINYPDGKIHFVTKKRVVSYYLRTNPQEKTGKYLSKNEMATIKLYMQKYYDEKALKALENEIFALNKYIDKSENLGEKLKDIYEAVPEQSRNMIEPIVISDKDYVKQWSEAPFEHKYISENVPSYKLIEVRG